MALNKLKFNSLNVTPAAGKSIGFNSSANGLEATFSGGAMTIVKKLTASSSNTLSFVNGSSNVTLDNTFKEYIFIFTNIHPGTDNVNFLFNMSADTGSNYNVTKTTTVFRAYHQEDNSVANLGYNNTDDLAQGTGFQKLAQQVGGNNDDSLSGVLHLFDPSSTTFVKHFISRVSQNYRSGNPAELDYFVAGYGNTTSAIDAVQFKMESGTIESGTITLYGIN
tara:strand:+ start:1546 stop:2211 length:666 start_codon:yes stop_codon:yes gene_type:complete